MDSAPSMSQSSLEAHNTQKQQLKSESSKLPSISPLKILLGVGAFFLLIMVSYKLYTELAPPAAKT
jgi:hypothetical protein